MTDIYFKVVRTTTIKNLYKSYCFRINSKLDLTYEVGKTTFPNIGKIFVFDTLDNANYFLDKENIIDHYNNKISILKVTVGGKIQKLNIQIPSYEGIIERYWYDSKIIFSGMIWPPNGTFLVDSVTVLEDQS